MDERGSQPQFTDQDVLKVFWTQEDPHAPLTASEVASELGCPRSTAFERLSALAEEGRLGRKTVGASEVWWHSTRDDDGQVDADDPLFTGGALFASEDPPAEADTDDIV